MKKLAVALFATTMLAGPAAFAATNNQQPSQAQQQPSQGQQMQHNQNQSQNQNAQKNGMSAQNRSGQTGMSQQNQQNAQNQQNQMSGQQQSAQNNQPIDPQDLSRGEIKQVQQALDKDGFKAGPTDGLWGHETRAALKQFQQSKQMQATGKLNEQTVADLGLDTSQFSQSQDQQSPNQQK